MFLEVEEGGRDPDEEAAKVYLIRFIADLPLSWYTNREKKNLPFNDKFVWISLAIVQCSHEEYSGEPKKN